LLFGGVPLTLFTLVESSASELAVLSMLRITVLNLVTLVNLDVLILTDIHKGGFTLQRVEGA
jgi:hypothetical protein